MDSNPRPSDPCLPSSTHSTSIVLGWYLRPTMVQGKRVSTSCFLNLVNMQDLSMCALPLFCQSQNSKNINTILPLTSTSRFDQHIQAFPHSEKCRQLLSETSRTVFQNKFLAMSRIKPRAAGWEAQILPLCYTPPQAKLLLLSLPPPPPIFIFWQTKKPSKPLFDESDWCSLFSCSSKNVCLFFMKSNILFWQLMLKMPRGASSASTKQKNDAKWIFFHFFFSPF